MDFIQGFEMPAPELKRCLFLTGNVPSEQNKHFSEGYIKIKVARDLDISKHIEEDIIFGLVDFEQVLILVVDKHLSFLDFKDLVAGLYHVNVQCQRFWLFEMRQNWISPLSRPLTPTEEEETVEKLSTKFLNGEIHLFLEVPPIRDSTFISLPIRTEEKILLFFKLYEPEKEKLNHSPCRYVGRMFVKGTDKPTEIVRYLNQMAGFSPHQEIELYEEVSRAAMPMPLDKTRTFQSSKFVDGDILWFQKSPSFQHYQLFRYADVPSFFEYMYNREVVYFQSLRGPEKDGFCLELSKKCKYAEVLHRAAKFLNLDDPSKIWLTAHFNGQPVPGPIKFTQRKELLDMLLTNNEKSNILYYIIKEIPLRGWECLRTLEVAFRSAKKWNEVAIYSISLPGESTVADLIDEIIDKVGWLPSTADIRLLAIIHSKIFKVFSMAEKIEDFKEHLFTLRAEEVPIEEKELGPLDHFIHVYHFKKVTGGSQMQIETFGEPFLLVIKDGETLGQIKIRIQMKLRVQAEEFSKWKFAYIARDEKGLPVYLKDEDIPWNWFRTANVSGALSQYLGLEHSSSSDEIDPPRSSEKVDLPSSSEKRPLSTAGSYQRARPSNIHPLLNE